MSTATLATIILIGGFFVLMLLRVPITFALMLATLGSAVVGGTNLTQMVNSMVLGANNFALLAIPFFILMGEIMAEGGMSEKIIDLTNLAVGRMRGGLAYINVLSSMLFGGISGSAVADVSSLGSVVVPMMKKQGYKPEFAVGLTVTTACQGVLIPPSHNMVIYALAAGGSVSAGTMLIAGMVPGISLGMALLGLCVIFARRFNFPRGTEESFKGRAAGIMLRAIAPMMIFVIIIGGIAAGIFTATESSAIACVYTFIITYVFFRSAKIRNFGHVLRRALKTLAIVMTLIATAKAFAYMMTDLRIPDQITRALLSVSQSKVVLLLLINLMLLVLGCVMDMAPLIMIMTPILLPVVTSPAIGMHPVHFGVMLIFNLAIGLCTPPVGSALYVGCAVGKTSLEATSKAMLPMYLTMVIALMFVIFIPAISLWLPGLH
ncbi:MAG TPA: TRAP transporter large permease [Candidatus Limnocylindria bacterium]|nr:TRAP transporter large permease [Candidatus Limnocylindria bacterium]